MSSESANICRVARKPSCFNEADRIYWGNALVYAASASDILKFYQNDDRIN